MKKEKKKKTDYVAIHTITATLFALSGIITLLDSGINGFSIMWIGLAITYGSIAVSNYKKEKQEETKKEKNKRQKYDF